MKIEHFYYDEQEKWFAQMKAAMKKHDAELSKEERTLEQKKSDMELQNIIQNAEREEKQTYRIVNTEKYCWFKNITKRVIQFAQLSGCNIKIETLPSMDAVIKMQTGCIWLLSDGETAQQDKRVIQELIDQAEHVYIGNSEREGKKVLDMEFIFRLYSNSGLFLYHFSFAVLIQFLRKVSASKICSRSAGVQSEIISRSFSSTAREETASL